MEKVLVTGGYDGNFPKNTVELYDPSTGTWAITDNMNHARFFHTASVLTNGKVLITGGTDDEAYIQRALNSAELY